MKICTYCGETGHALADCRRRRDDRERERKDDERRVRNDRERHRREDRIRQEIESERGSQLDSDSAAADDDDEDLEERKARARRRAEEDVAVQVEAEKARKRAVRRAKEQEEREAQERRQERATQEREDVLRRAVTRDEIEAVYRQLNSSRDEAWIAARVNEKVFERLSTPISLETFDARMRMRSLHSALEPSKIDASLGDVLRRAQELFPDATDEEVERIAVEWGEAQYDAYERHLEEEDEVRRKDLEDYTLESDRRKRMWIVAAAIGTSIAMVAVAIYWAYR